MEPILNSPSFRNHLAGRALYLRARQATASLRPIGDYDYEILHRKNGRIYVRQTGEWRTSDKI